jgi:hypothetical protein
VTTDDAGLSLVLISTSDVEGGRAESREREPARDVGRLDEGRPGPRRRIPGVLEQQHVGHRDPGMARREGGDGSDHAVEFLRASALDVGADLDLRRRGRTRGETRPHDRYRRRLRDAPSRDPFSARPPSTSEVEISTSDSPASSVVTGILRHCLYGDRARPRLAVETPRFGKRVPHGYRQWRRMPVTTAEIGLAQTPRGPVMRFPERIVRKAYHVHDARSFPARSTTSKAAPDLATGSGNSADRRVATT